MLYDALVVPKFFGAIMKTLPNDITKSFVLKKLHTCR
jgi:hypothetical protein